MGAKAAYDDVRSAGDDVMVPSLASGPRPTKTTKDVRFGLEPVPALRLLCSTVEMVCPPSPCETLPQTGPRLENQALPIET